MVDNYDSFVFNLVHYLNQIDIAGRAIEVVIKRNDQLTLADIKQIAPTHIVISPGPCRPDQAGMSLAIVEEFARSIPILGVCLGHQVIGQILGAKVVKADRVVHGKTSAIYHAGHGVFKGLPQGFMATRYHSLVLDPSSIPSYLEVISWTAANQAAAAEPASMSQGFNAERGDLIMGIKHREYPLQGIQFHPESILSEHGLKLLSQFFQSGSAYH